MSLLHCIQVRCDEPNCDRTLAFANDLDFPEVRKRLKLFSWSYSPSWKSWKDFCPEHTIVNPKTYKIQSANIDGNLVIHVLIIINSTSYWFDFKPGDGYYSELWTNINGDMYNLVGLQCNIEFTPEPKPKYKGLLGN